MNDGAAVSDWVDLKSEINCISIDLTRSRFLTGTDDGRIEIWDLKSGHHLLGPLEYRAPVHSAVFTPDGYVLAAAGTSLVSWDATTGRQVAVAENVTPGHAQMVGSDEPTPPELIVDLKITRDGSRIIALYGSKQEYDFDSEIDAYNNGVDIYNFRGRYEATQVGLWSRDLKLIKALNGRDDILTFVAVSPDGKLFATATHNGNVRVWATESGRQLGTTLSHSSTVKQLNFTAQSDRLIVTEKSDRISIWAGWSELARPSVFKISGPTRRVLVGSPTGSLLTLSGSGMIQLWDDITGQTVIDDLEIKEGNVIRSDLSGETIAILDRTGQVWIWRLPLPKTDAERCDLVEISERAGGYGLNENDIPVAIENLNSLGRVYSEQCDVLKYRPSSSLHDWISEVLRQPKGRSRNAASPKNLHTRFI